MESTQADYSILFIGKKEDEFSKKAANLTLSHFGNTQIVYSKRTDPFPEALFDWQGNIIISYLSQWIIPEALLSKAKVAAINFHPGPPEYPGIGCTNFAIYNGEQEFGVTCHHMEAKVDTGAIISVKRFPLFADDTVFDLTQKCYKAIFELYANLLSIIKDGGDFPLSNETWKRKPFTRKQLNELCTIKPGMRKDEIELRLKATTYGEKVWGRVLINDEMLSYEDALKKKLI